MRHVAYQPGMVHILHLGVPMVRYSTGTVRLKGVLNAPQVNVLPKRNCTNVSRIVLLHFEHTIQKVFARFQSPIP